MPNSSSYQLNQVYQSSLSTSSFVADPKLLGRSIQPIPIIWMEKAPCFCANGRERSDFL